MKPRIFGLENEYGLIFSPNGKVYLPIEKVLGYLDGGIAGWILAGNQADYIPQIGVDDLQRMRAEDPGSVNILDVREPGETETAAIDGSLRIPLGQLAYTTEYGRRVA